MSLEEHPPNPRIEQAPIEQAIARKAIRVFTDIGATGLQSVSFRSNRE